MFLLRSCLRGNSGGSSSSAARIVAARTTPQVLRSSHSPSSALSAPRSAASPPAQRVRPSATRPDLLVHRLPRSFSSSSGNSGKGGGGRHNDGDGHDDFFLRDEASLPAPPSYVRDEVTGKWTSETEKELSARERKLLGMRGDQKDEALLARLEGRWEAAAAPAGDRPLTPRELQALQGYAAREHGVRPAEFARRVEDDPDLIPHHAVSSGADGVVASKQFFDADLDLAHLRPGLHRRAFTEGGADDPFADLLPADLNPARKVNRRHAKLLPRQLLHHNNLALLRRYTTPGGKIMNRVQSRLGAKDQRKIAKLVKRARHLGLIPYMGQWKFEDHGNRAAGHVDGGRDEKPRDWEEELEERGLWPLADETELVKRFYDVDRMMEHIAGPKGGKKREELDRLVGATGSLGLDDSESKVDGGSS